MYFAETTKLSQIKVFSVAYDLSLSNPFFMLVISIFSHLNVRFSILSKKQMLCVTAQENVILLSISTSRIMIIIDLNATSFAFDEDLCYLIIYCDESISVYTINATFVLEHKLDCRVCSVRAFGKGFSQNKRFIACGVEDGRIVILGSKIKMISSVCTKLILTRLISIQYLQ